jgi:hypothetical protein
VRGKEIKAIKASFGILKNSSNRAKNGKTHKKITDLKHFGGKVCIFV